MIWLGIVLMFLVCLGLAIILWEMIWLGIVLMFLVCLGLAIILWEEQ